jgi:pyrroloquinoline-quinone synthase
MQQQGSLSARIDAAVAARSMLAHPFYQAWSEGRLSQDTLRAYACQYLHHVVAFPRAVSAVHAQCPDRAGRRMLAENLAEEEGVGEGKSDHASLWMDFTRGLGASAAEADGAALNGETIALIETFARLSRQSYAAGLGALYAYESQLPAVSTTKIDGLERFYGVADEATLSFFRVHERADVEHAAVCRALIDKLSADERAEAESAAAELAGALWDFLSGVQKSCGPMQ